MSLSPTNARILALVRQIHSLLDGQGPIALAALLVETGSALEVTLAAMEHEPPEVITVLTDVIKITLGRILPELEAYEAKRATPERAH